MKCMYCTNKCIKAGRQKNGAQRLFCKTCQRYQLETYRSQAWRTTINESIKSLLVEGMGIRGIARFLKISVTAVLKRIRVLAKLIRKPFTTVAGRVFEIDEVWTYVAKKTSEVWITYAIDRKSKEVMDFRLGSRSGIEIGGVVIPLIVQKAKRICTDGLNVYKGLVPQAVHRVGSFHTQSIERFNLNLRTHLKRLSRKTICFSKSLEMLQACLKIYFWGGRSVIG
jgi:insertion element IS1 protein InsB